MFCICVPSLIHVSMLLHYFICHCPAYLLEIWIKSYGHFCIFYSGLTRPNFAVQNGEPGALVTDLQPVDVVVSHVLKLILSKVCFMWPIFKFLRFITLFPVTDSIFSFFV